MRLVAFLPILAIALVVVAWLPAAGAPYQYDDYNTPVGDAASQSLSAWWHAMPGTLRPLTKLTYAVESSLGAGSAPARRVLNALLFSGCAALLAALLEAMGAPALVAALVACVWAIHPVHAETVVALAGRPVLLSLCLVLASAWLVLRARPRAALALAVLALLARESALPWLVACAAWLAHERGVPRQRMVALSFGALGAGAVLLLSSKGLRGLVVSAFSAAGSWNRLGLQWAALTKGTAMLALEPQAFAPDIEFAPNGWARGALILITLGCYVAAGWLVLGRHRRRELRLFALLWLCLVLPTHSVAPKLDVLTARPFSAGLAPLLGLLTCGLVTPGMGSPRGRVVMLAALMAALTLLFPLTRYRAELYRDPIALWRDAAQRTTHSVRPLVNLGTLLARQGRLREAQGVLTKALARDPSRYDTRIRLITVQRALQAQRPPAVDEKATP